MADLMRVTPPVIGSDNMGRVQQQVPGEPTIQNVPDPTRVTGPNTQNANTDRQQYEYSPNYRSNFERFLQFMRGSSSFDTVHQLLFSRMGNIVNAGIGEDFARQIAEFMEMMKLNDTQLLDAVLNNQRSAVKFSGNFFDILRQVMNSSAMDDVKLEILNFLKRYDNVTAGNHILKGILNNLNNIAARMPQSASQTLQEFINQMQSSHPNGLNGHNLSVLKGSIMPFLSNYIGRTHDFGSVRDFITQLTLQVARYESADRQGFSDALSRLFAMREVSSRLPGVDLQVLGDLLLSGRLNSSNDNAMQKLVDIIAAGLSGEGGAALKADFENILGSFLINESVYMPLNHMMIPAEIDGKLLFSEIWVDPNSKGGADGESEGEEGRRLLIKFDIKDLGFFEIIMYEQDGKVTFSLYYPQSLKGESPKFKADIDKILEDNNLELSKFFQAVCTEPKSLSEVFPKITERKNSINVII